jgi:surface polysaccharide O-acyltransferase-like enzyme
MASTVKNTDTQWLDTLRALATFGVIIIHVATPTLKMNFTKNIEFWWVGNVIDCAVRFAVPIFLILTGATMLNREYELGEFYKKRLKRVFVPFAFWMVVYWVFRWFMLLPRQQPKELMAILKWAGNLFMTEGISKHFWYFYMILAIYCIVPFLGRFLRKLSSSTILYFLIGWVVLCYLLRAVPMNMYGWTNNPIPGKLLGWFLHGCYLIVGYYLFNLPNPSPKARSLWFFAFLLSIVSAAVLTYFFSMKAHKLDLSVYGYLKLNTIIQSVTLVMAVKGYCVENKFLFRIQQEICNYSYGIYLAHVMVLGILFDHGIYWNIAHPVISVPLVSILTLVLCYLIVFGMRKIPFGKYVAG